MTFRPLTPENWPQDELRPPNGMGGMPPISKGNLVNDREFFAISSLLTWAPGTAAQVRKQNSVATPQDGDFWCDSIGVVSWLEDTTTVGLTQNRQLFLATMITLKDQRTGRDLFYNQGLGVGAGAGLIPLNSVPINMFRRLPQSGTEVGTDYNGNTPVPAGFRSVGSLIQPYCFTRQGGIEITSTSLFAVPAGWTFFQTICFSGWKEFEHASR